MAKRKPTIERVKDNTEKYFSYRENLKKYNKAKASGYYFECLWILYAMIEDRTSSFLYHIGFTSSSNQDSVTGSRKIKKQIREILGMVNQNDKYRFNTLNGKLDRIKQVIGWNCDLGDDTADYQREVFTSIRRISNINELLSCIDYLNDEWRDKRNQLMHALFNKSLDAVECEFADLLDKGYRAVRILDNAVHTLRKRKIRVKFKIQ